MGNLLTCTVHGHSIALDIDDISAPDGNLYTTNTELWRAKRYGDFEPDTIQWIDEHFAAGDVIYDVGANIGQYALYAAKSLRDRCRVLAFEPEALNYAKLNKNIVLNKLSGVVIPYCLALTDRTRLDALHVHSFVPGAAFHAFGESMKQGNVPFSPVHTQGMIGVSLDDLTGRFALPFPTHLKIDVDGAELSVIRGATGTLSDRRLKTVMIEIYLDEARAAASEIMSAMRAASFVLENAGALDQKMGTAPNFMFSRAQP